MGVPVDMAATGGLHLRWVVAIEGVVGVLVYVAAPGKKFLTIERGAVGIPVPVGQVAIEWAMVVAGGRGAVGGCSGGVPWQLSSVLFECTFDCHRHLRSHIREPHPSPAAVQCVSCTHET